MSPTPYSAHHLRQSNPKRSNRNHEHSGFDQGKSETMTFCDDIEAESAPQREAMMRHPFVLGIGDGTLSNQRFKHFMTQDYLYLVDYARVLAMGTVKAPDLTTMSWFASAVDYILNTEMALHRSYCASIGISSDELEVTVHAPTTYSYTSYLLRVAQIGSFGELIAALVPCIWGYWQVGEMLADAGEPESAPHYAEWIRTYASEESKTVALEARAICDRAAAEAGPTELAAMREAYITCTRYEIAFWQMAWDLEEWPV